MTRIRTDIPVAGTPEAKARRVARHDLSRLSDEQRERRLLVIHFGEHAFGARWQTPLADALGELRRQSTAPVQIAAWASGARPVPERVIDELLQLAPVVARELRARAERVAAWPFEPGEAGWTDTRTTEEVLRDFGPMTVLSVEEELGLDENEGGSR